MSYGGHWESGSDNRWGRSFVSRGKIPLRRRDASRLPVQRANVTNSSSTDALLLLVASALWPTGARARAGTAFLPGIYDKGVRMKKALVGCAIVLFAVSISLTAGAERVGAQGPAGAGAAEAAQESSHSLNPMKWMKKDSKNSSDAAGNRSEAEKKLTPGLRAEGLLPADASTTDACAPFTALDACLAVLHASHNLGVDFNCLRAVATGVHTSANVSDCKAVDGDKGLGLKKAIHELKPDANAKQATKDAEQQADDDLKKIGA
jgi:hypothetical protein